MRIQRRTEAASRTVHRLTRRQMDGENVFRDIAQAGDQYGRHIFAGTPRIEDPKNLRLFMRKTIEPRIAGRQFPNGVITKWDHRLEHPAAATWGLRQRADLSGRAWFDIRDIKILLHPLFEESMIGEVQRQHEMVHAADLKETGTLDGSVSESMRGPAGESVFPHFMFFTEVKAYAITHRFIRMMSTQMPDAFTGELSRLAREAGSYPRLQYNPGSALQGAKESFPVYLHRILTDHPKVYPWIERVGMNRVNLSFDAP